MNLFLDIQTYSYQYIFNKMNSYGDFKTVLILNSWFHQKPADLDLHCFLFFLIIGFNIFKEVMYTVHLLELVRNKFMTLEQL